MLKILGIVFLILIGLAVVFFTWLFFKVKGGMQQQARVSAIEEGMQTEPVVLEPTERPELAQPEIVARLIEQVVGLGAVGCGSFDVPAASVRLCAYTLQTPPVYIVIYDHDEVDPWTDVVLRLNAECSFTASTVPEIARGAPRHPDDEIVFFAPGTMTGVLVKAAAERAAGNDALSATPEAFKAYFEEAAEKSSKYIQTQTVDQEWLATIAEDAGIELTGDEAAQINFGRTAEQVTQTENDCFKTLAASGDFTAAQWNDLRESLVAVWDDMPGEYVAAVFYNHVEVPAELESAIDALEEGRGLARERVALVNAELAEEQRLILIGTVSSPVEADIYRDQVPVV